MECVKLAQAEAGKDDLPVVMYVAAKRGGQKSDIVCPPASTPCRKRPSMRERTVISSAGWWTSATRSRLARCSPRSRRRKLDRELDQSHAARAQAKANLDLARVTAERYASLLKEEAVSPQEVDEKNGVHQARKADYAAAEANLRRLEQMKSFQRVTAPSPALSWPAISTSDH
jgi:hypothetical protein